MNNLITIFRVRPCSWKGCRPLSAAERMARYSARSADEMRQRENEGAAAPRTRIIDGRQVLIALDGRVNQLPKPKREMVEDCPQPEYPIRERAYTPEQLKEMK